MHHRYVDSDTLKEARARADEIAREQIADAVWDRGREAPGGLLREQAESEAFAELYPPAFDRALSNLLRG